VKWQRWHVVAAGAALALASAFALAKWSGSPDSAADASAAAEPLAKAPEDLLADIYVAAPNASWTKLQRGVGGAVGILPATLPGLLVALADLDVSLASELDGAAPMFGVVAGDPAAPGVAFAFALKLVDARRARGILVDGDTSRFAAQDADGMTVLVPKGTVSRSANDNRFEIAITQNGYLLVTRAAPDLVRLGPYVTRTLPARPLPTESAAVIDVPRSALKTMLQPKLDALWKDGKSFLLAQDERMRAERGRAPDFGDPAAIVATLDAVLARRSAIVGDLEKVRLALDITDDATVLTATLSPGSDGPARVWIDAMKVGDAAPVLELPAASALAMSMRDGDAERAEQAKELESAITASLGQRLQDPTKLHEVIEAMTTARDESVALALTVDEPTGLLVRVPVRDNAAADKAIRGLFDMTTAKPFKELLRVREVVSSSEELPGLGKISSLLVVRDPNPKRAADKRPTGDARAPAASAKTSPGSGVAWLTEQGVLALGAGGEPAVTLKMGARPDRKLADEPALRRFTGAIGADASTIVIAQPLRIDPKRANLPTAPLGIAIGRKGSDAFVRIDIADGLLREAARWQMGF